MLQPRYGWGMRQASALLLVPDRAFDWKAFLLVSVGHLCILQGVFSEIDNLSIDSLIAIRSNVNETPWCCDVTWRQVFPNMTKVITDTSNLWLSIYFKISCFYVYSGSKSISKISYQSSKSRNFWIKMCHLITYRFSISPKPLITFQLLMTISGA